MSATASASDPAVRRRFWRIILIAHRWLGIALGVLVLAWCVSGVVMMYVSYPSLSEEEALAGLSELVLDDCCLVPEQVAVSALVVESFRVEDAAGRPVMRAMLPGGGRLTIDLTTGRERAHWPDTLLIPIGEAFAVARGWSPPVAGAQVVRDQWTVTAFFDPHRPLLRLGNEDGREWYLSSTTGEVVQETARWERGWSRVGAVTHWLYPTVLRQHTRVWAQVVIWLTVVSLFLAVTGLVIGVRQFGRRADGRRSPFRGWTLWHHYAGLGFGLLTLTWLGSGLLSMNPWSVLTPDDFSRERAALNGTRQTVADVVRAVNGIAPVLPAGTVRVTGVGWAGRSYLIARDRDGNVTRFHRDAVPAGVTEAQVRAAAALLREADFDVELIAAPDAYHYRLKGQPELPAYRIRYADGVRFYVSPATGLLLTTVGPSDRRFRWLFDALHRGDFSAVARSRPLWDVMMILLLGGVTVGVASGVWLGIRRLRLRRNGSGTGATAT